MLRLIGDEGMTDSMFFEILKKLYEVPTCISMLLIALIPGIPCGELVFSIKNGNKHGCFNPDSSVNIKGSSKPYSNISRVVLQW